jgi:phospholipid/cholesterol/gamma-HCH transport system substrate-binding protein
LGDAVIDFVPGDEPLRGEPITDRSTFTRVIVERNPVELIDVALNLEQQVSETLTSIRRASDTVTTAGDEIARLANTVQDALGDENSDFKQFLTATRNLATRAETAIDNFNTLMVNINEFTGDPEARAAIRESLRRLPELLDEVNMTVRDTRATITEFRKVGESAGENLTNLTEFTRALGENGPNILEQLNDSIGKVNIAVTDFGVFASGVRRTDGTLGKLFNDPELYDNLNETARNLRDLSIQLQPLMNDVRFAVDGIARDPGQLGIRGAFDRRPAFGGFKGNPPPAPGLLESPWQNW